MNEDKTYLGDGVYASNDGFHIILKTDGASPIYLDGEVITSLLRYIERIKNVTIKVTKKEEIKPGDYTMDDVPF